MGRTRPAGEACKRPSSPGSVIFAGRNTEMLYRNKLLLAASTGVLFAMTAGIAQAADTKEADPLQEIVVTGVANSKGERKQDAAFAITTANEEAMKDAA